MKWNWIDFTIAIPKENKQKRNLVVCFHNDSENTRRLANSEMAPNDSNREATIFALSKISNKLLIVYCLKLKYIEKNEPMNILNFVRPSHHFGWTNTSYGCDVHWIQWMRFRKITIFTSSKSSWNEHMYRIDEKNLYKMCIRKVDKRAMKTKCTKLQSIEHHNSIAHTAINEFDQHINSFKWTTNHYRL